MLYPIFYGFIAPDMAAENPLGAARAAIDFAGKLGAQLTVGVGALQIAVPNILGSDLVRGLVADERKRAEASAAAALEQVNELARNTGLTLHSEVIAGDLNTLKKSFVARTRVHGLAFAEAGIPGELLGGTLIEPLLFESGRPVVIVPNGHASGISLDRVIIAWDGSASAARAVWDAVPVLRLAGSVEIVTVAGEKELTDTPPANALAGMLTFLGKKMTVTNLTFDGGTAAGPIKRHAAKTGAGLIIQGAYGRSRWREFVLGGVTREMLRDNKLPVLMAH